MVGRSRPGPRSAAHRHPYEETFIVEDEKAASPAAREGTIEATAGQIVVPAGTPHKFVSRGFGRLRQIGIRPLPC